MAVLKQGAPLKITGNAQIDSLIPLTVTATKTLAAGTDQRIQVDPTLGDIVLTLPDAASNSGLEFFIKRTVNGGNIVSLDSAGSDTIDDTDVGYILSLINEYIGVYSDGTTSWKIFDKDIFSICSMTATAQSFVVTTSPTKFTSWDTVIFDTPSKLIGNLTTDVVDMVEFQGPVTDGYTVNITFGFTYTNNNIVTGQILVNGILTGVPVNVNALGAGKPTSIVIIQQIGITSTTTLELHLSAENAGTINDINAVVQVQRIGR